ncbi:MAG: PD-(D/E)XK nuclease family protein [Candidatus Shapirobacteria bacterium]
MADKYTALWISHSSLTDFFNCPRAYFLKNIYKTPKTNRKIQIISPALSLGSAIHEVIEVLSTLPVEKRFDEALPKKFEQIWQKYQGKKGGFTEKTTEEHYYRRGMKIITRLVRHPGPLKKLAVKIKTDLPQYWLSEKDQIILCGKIDWLEFQPETQTVRIIDFKTSRREESPESLQLPIYYLLAGRNQRYPVSAIAYWYLDSSDQPTEKSLPDGPKAEEKILKAAKKIKLARQLEHLICPDNGCRHCLPLEKIVKGEAELVGLNTYGQECYLLPAIDSTNRETIL